MNKDVLSINRFKGPDGKIDINKLSEEDFTAYTFSSLMNRVIEILEMAVTETRQFNRAKYEIMKEFHSTFENYESHE